jgi:hypothetical protein
VGEYYFYTPVTCYISIMSKRSAYTLAAVFAVTSGVWAGRDNWLLSLLFAVIAMCLAVLDTENKPD